MEKKTILVTGANGQLGSEMQVIAKVYPSYNFLFVTKDQLSIDDAQAVSQYFTEHSIDYCVNCAAYTAVDKAESDVENAMLINATATGNLAAVCKANNAGFVHISTDYVFDGTATTPYKETDPVSPVNLYGASKLKGEELAIENNPAAIIIRTSWVYSSFGNNFVKTMLRLMKDRESINVVSDQQGCPTYAADLAAAIMQVIEKLESNDEAIDKALTTPAIFNYSNSGVITWFQFSDTIRALSGSGCKVNPIPAAQYPTPARRPHYSVMDTTKIKQAFDLTIPAWEDSLKKCLKILQSQ